MRTTLEFVPLYDVSSETYPATLNATPIEDETGNLQVPMLHDLVVFNLQEGEAPHKREVVRRTLYYTPGQVHIVCATKAHEES